MARKAKRDRRKRLGHQRAAKNTLSTWVGPATREALSRPEIVESILSQMGCEIFTVRHVCKTWRDLVHRSTQVGLYAAAQTQLIRKIPIDQENSSINVEFDKEVRHKPLPDRPERVAIHPSLEIRLRYHDWRNWSDYPLAWLGRVEICTRQNWKYHPFARVGHIDLRTWQRFVNRSNPVELAKYIARPPAHTWDDPDWLEFYQLSLTISAEQESWAPTANGKYLWERRGLWRELQLCRPGIQALRLCQVDDYYNSLRDQCLWRRERDAWPTHGGVELFDERGLTLGDLFDSIDQFVREELGVAPDLARFTRAEGLRRDWHFKWDVV